MTKLQILAYVMAIGGAAGILIGYGEKRYGDGVEATEMAQEKANQEVRDRFDAARPKLTENLTEYFKKLGLRDETLQNAYTQADLEAQWRYGHAAGQKAARAQLQGQGFDDLHACVALPYAPDDGMRLSGQSLQRDVSASYRGFEERSAEAGLRDTIAASGQGSDGLSDYSAEQPER